tara:strand:- start:201 stop:506 length:306 start_codon:yes stop_codon:yes gene_type:complete
MIPNIHFESEEEFIEQMYEHAHVINISTMDAIEMAMLTYESDPVIAHLNDDYELRLESGEWLTNLDRVREYFEYTEDYDMCKKVVTLTNKVKTFLGKDLVN